MRRLDINYDITQASTPPAEFYRDNDWFQRQREELFATSWQFIGDVNLARVPGEAAPFSFLEGLLDEPLVVVRDGQDKLRCMSNVCTHRGNLVVESRGNFKSLRCRYHGRRFGLDGCFEHMPHFEQAANFPSAADNLPHVPMERWGPFLFASLKPLVPFEELIQEMQDRVGWMPLDDFKFDPQRSRDYLVRAHWALYCENYLEGFHIPFVHASLNESLDTGAYRTELFRYSSLQLGVAKGAETAFKLPPASAEYGQSIAAYYFWIFPNMMFNFYPWGCSVNVVKPVSTDLTRVSFLSYVWDESKLDQGAGMALDRVEREDEAIVEAVQRGLRSRLYYRGRYSPTHEMGTHHFHRLIANELDGGKSRAESRSGLSNVANRKPDF